MHNTKHETPGADRGNVQTNKVLSVLMNEDFSLTYADVSMCDLQISTRFIASSHFSFVHHQTSGHRPHAIATEKQVATEKQIKQIAEIIASVVESLPGK